MNFKSRNKNIVLYCNKKIKTKVILLNRKTYTEKYAQLTDPIRKNSKGIKIIRSLDKITTTTVYLTYIVFLGILLFNRDSRFLRVLIAPAISFVILSMFRGYNNAPRPYQEFDIEPIIVKDTQGKSFPSRHVFSTFLIAMTLYYISMPIGISLMVIGSAIALIRVIGGVHFPRDVIAGALIGIIFGIIGWNLRI